MEADRASRSELEVGQAIRKRVGSGPGRNGSEELEVNRSELEVGRDELEVSQGTLEVSRGELEVRPGKL